MILAKRETNSLLAYLNKKKLKKVSYFTASYSLSVFLLTLFSVLFLMCVCVCVQSVSIRLCPRRVRLWGWSWMKRGESTRASWESSPDWSRDMTTSERWVCSLRFINPLSHTLTELHTNTVWVFKLHLGGWACVYFSSSWQRTSGYRRTDSTQSLSFEPPSPTLLSPQSLSPLPLSSFPFAFPSPEEVRGVIGTSPCQERTLSVCSSESTMVRGCRSQRGRSQNTP